MSKLTSVRFEPDCVKFFYFVDLIVTTRIRSMMGRYCFHRCLSVNISGVGGGTWSQIFWEGTRSQDFGGGRYLVSDFRGGYPVLVKGKIFDSRFGLIHVQTGEKKFLLRDPPPPRNSKKTAMATRRAVCLLRSRRRTFLLVLCFQNCK